jgi:uncharacterized protein DUF5665
MKEQPAIKGSGVNYERLGRAVEDALVTDYIELLHNTHRQIWSSFIRGAFAGLGGVIGATVGVAVLVALLVALGHTPVVGHWFTKTGQMIENRSPSK